MSVTEVAKWVAILLVGVLVGMYGRSVYLDLAFLHKARVTYDAQVAKKVGETNGR